MSISWLRLLACNLGLLSLLSLSGCWGPDNKIAQLNACVKSPNFRALNCQEGADVRNAATLRRILTICDGQLHLDGVLPLSAYRYCQRALLDHFDALQTPQCEEIFVDHVRCVLRSNLVKEISVQIHSDGPVRDGSLTPVTGRIHSQDLQAFLVDLGQWYMKTAQKIYRSAALERVKSQGLTMAATRTPSLLVLSEEQQRLLLLREIADQDQREVLDNFWKAVTYSSKSDQLLERQLDFYSQNEASLQVAEGVILQQDYPAPLLLRILGSSLKVLSDRVSYLAGIADVGCSIENCRGNTNTELFKIVSLLGSLGSRSEFQELSPMIDGVNRRLGRFFDSLKRNTEVIEQSLIRFAALEGGEFLDEARSRDILDLDLALVPDFGRGILSIVQSNRILKNSYQTNGFYSWKGSEFTEFGFSTNLDSIKEIAAHSRQHFDAKWDEFQRNRREYGREVLQEQTWQNSVARLDADAQRQLERVTEVGEDLNGLRASLSSANKRAADYMTRAFSVLDSPSYREGYGSRYSVERTLPPFTIAPAHAPRHPSSPNIREIMVGEVGAISLEKGQIASIQIDRNWSPTCALRRSGFKRESVAGALIGPEGFMMGMSEGKANVSSVSEYSREDKSHRAGTSLSLCMKSSMGILGDLIGQQPSISACAEYSYGETKSSGKNTDQVDSKESRQQASFNLGIRSEFAPFSAYPAGSLLIVQVKKGGQSRHSDILSIEVAQRSNQILAKDDVDLYFVVNDCKDGLNSDQGLQLNAEVRTQEGETARKVAQAMVRAVEFLDEKLDSILLQGDVSSQQMSTLRNEMFMKLASDPEGRSMQALGPVLSEFFNFWVENELLQIEKQSRIRRLERNLKNELSNLARIEADIERTKGLGRFYELQKLWSLDSLDMNQFTQNLKSAIEKLNRYILPVVAFQAPQRIKYLSSRDSAKFIRNGLSLETSVDDIARAIKNIYEDLTEGEELSRLVFNGWRTTDVVLSFPHPALSDRLRVAPLVDDPLSLWKQGSRTTAEALWAALASGQVSAPVTLSLTPEDLYDANQRIPDTLNCTQTSPVIQSMGLYFVIPDNTGDGPGAEYEFNLSFRAQGSMKFPGENWLHSFTLVGESQETWMRQTIPYTVGLRQQAKTILDRTSIDPHTKVGSGAGLSPFMDFNLDFGRSAFGSGGPLAGYTSGLREILVVMRLKYRPSTVESMRWMPVCATQH